jgi:hypothetical protein
VIKLCVGFFLSLHVDVDWKKVQFKCRFRYGFELSGNEVDSDDDSDNDNDNENLDNIKKNDDNDDCDDANDKDDDAKKNRCLFVGTRRALTEHEQKCDKAWVRCVF